ncbi:MAG TPA: ABC transporter ATP-binding protein [Caldilineaceae bacterium]|nr:ABC transporter ATP-binding protein [Caldilineaceae bacterium]
MPILELNHLAKSYGPTTILHDVTLAVEPGNFMVIYGTPSSGKSVLVRLLTGLERPDRGGLILRGQDLTHASAGERNIGYVPQSFALYPHMNVYKNIAYPLTLARLNKREIEPAVQRVAELLGIAELLQRKPDQLSGGQKQRVAIARGLVKNTDLFILDDPLVGLDFKLRERLIDDLKQTQKTLGVTFVYTTSDAVETLMLARTVAVLHEGRIVETGDPLQLYAAPQRAETMKYVGFPQANFVEGKVAQGGRSVETSLFTMPVASNLSAGQTVAVGIRPEHINLAADAPDDAISGRAKVLLREDLGGEEIVYLDVAGRQLTTVLRSDDESQAHVNIDQMVTYWIAPADLIVYADSQRIID